MTQAGNSQGFTHLHLHTQYSLLDGAIRLDDLLPTIAGLILSADPHVGGLVATTANALGRHVEINNLETAFGTIEIERCALFQATYRRTGDENKGQ